MTSRHNTVRGITRGALLTRACLAGQATTLRWCRLASSEPMACAGTADIATRGSGSGHLQHGERRPVPAGRRQRDLAACPGRGMAVTLLLVREAGTARHRRDRPHPAAHGYRRPHGRTGPPARSAHRLQPARTGQPGTDLRVLQPGEEQQPVRRHPGDQQARPGREEAGPRDPPGAGLRRHQPTRGAGGGGRPGPALAGRGDRPGPDAHRTGPGVLRHLAPGHHHHARRHRPAFYPQDLGRRRARSAAAVRPVRRATPRPPRSSAALPRSATTAVRWPSTAAT